MSCLQMRDRILWVAVILCLLINPLDRRSLLAAVSPGTVGLQLQELHNKISPAVVQIISDAGEKRRFGLGVVLTDDGYAVTIHSGLAVQAFQRDEPVVFLFSDGRRALAAFTGLYAEGNIAVAKTKEPGDWPHVARTLGMPEPGQLCAAISYPRSPFEFETKPSLSLGACTSTTKPFSFSATCPVGLSSAMFTLDGRFMGLLTVKSIESDGIYTPAARIFDHWAQLTQGAPARDSGERNKLAKAADVSGLGAVENNNWSDAIRKAAKATVRIVVNGEGGWTSGVIVGDEDYVATCGHRGMAPGAPARVLLSDGRDVDARVVGVDAIADVGLLHIVNGQDLPHVDFGESLPLEVNDECWVVGYPGGRQSREPLVRRTKVESNGFPSPVTIHTSLSVEIFPGDSGGGLFDSRGRLVGLHQGSNGYYLRHSRVEVLQKEWQQLLTSQVAKAPAKSDLDSLSASFVQELGQGSKLTVDIVRKNVTCASGTIIGDRIVTKASELYGDISVRLPDGGTHRAVTVKSSRAYDLALLTVAGTPSGGRLCDKDGPNIGQPVAAILNSKPPRFGIISHEGRSIPRERAEGLTGMVDAKSAVMIANDERMRERGIPLSKGDVLKSIDGRAVSDLRTFLALTGSKSIQGSLGITAGDPVSATVRRGAGDTDVVFVWPGSDRLHNQSARWSNYHVVLDTDVVLEPRQCGSPLVDHDGRVVGIAIACRGDLPGQTHVIPAEIIREFIANDP
jgi:S1-C subfamily serine protease